MGCRSAVEGSIEWVGGVNQPSDDVLAHSGEHHAEEPAVAASGASLEQGTVELLALDGTLGTGTTLCVTLPEIAVPGDQGMQAIVLLRIGIDDAAIR